ncbi:family 43 glycosylhydrolase [Phocaeicola coprocola]|uniref:family 43 glycosylhydrolase n=1 Tax=Phocaeicola coprocola TaxID=310298 RepID=UPI0029430023|nr:family 43 glycosylhydrolase [Phocaeicola coprocola]
MIRYKLYCSKGYHVLSSFDLKHWNIKKKVFSSCKPNDNINYSDAVLYAPDCIERNGKYFLYYCMSDNSEGVASGDKPDKFYKDGLKLPVDGIDPAVFIDDDGQAYYYWGQFSACGAKLNNDMRSIDTTTIKRGLVTEEEHRFHEGSWMFKRNGIYYYVYAALNKRGEATAIDYSTSHFPLGPFTYGGTIIDNFGCDPCVWNNHGSVAEYNGQWYIFYHRATHGCQSMRKACVEKIYFREDGSIPQVEMTSQGAADPLDAFHPIEADRACNLTGKVRIVRSGIDREELAKIEHYDRAIYKYLNFKRIPTSIQVKVASQAGGKILVLTDSYVVHAIIDIPEGNNEYREFTAEVSGIKVGISQLKFRFEGAEDKDLMRLDSFYFR